MGPHTITHESVSLRWDDPADSSVAGYQILRRNRSLHATGVYSVLQEDPKTAETCYVDSEVEAGRRYVYRVKARNAGGLSPQGSTLDANLPAAPDEEPTPR